MECFAALYLYGAFSVVYRIKQKKPASPFTSDERTSRVLGCFGVLSDLGYFMLLYALHPPTHLAG